MVIGRTSGRTRAAAPNASWRQCKQSDNCWVGGTRVAVDVSASGLSNIRGGRKSVNCDGGRETRAMGGSPCLILATIAAFVTFETIRVATDRLRHNHCS